MDAGEALAILTALADSGCRAWVHGGWGVDALLREQTRPHDDLDLVVEVERWPSVDPPLEGYLAHLASKLEGADVDAALQKVKSDDLWVAFACSGEACFGW